MIEWIFDTLAYLTALSTLIPLLLVLINKKMAFSLIWKAIFLLCVLSICSNFISLIFTKKFQNNIPIFHLYVGVEFVIYGFLYYFIFQGKLMKKIILGYLLIYILVFLSLFSYFKSIWTVNEVPRILANTFLIFLSVSYFLKVLRELKYESILKDDFFWFNTAVFFYFGTTFYIVIFEGFIRSYEYDLLLFTWPVQLISMIIYNLILAKGIWTMSKLSS